MSDMSMIKVVMIKDHFERFGVKYCEIESEGAKEICLKNLFY